MPKNDPGFPDDVQIITDLETLQVVADPLRLRLLALLRREPQTVKTLAAALAIAPTKLYYHIKLLEERGLIRIAGVRPGAGPAEKEYAVTAYRLSVDRALLSPNAPTADDALDTFLSMVLDHSKSEIKRSVRAGLIDPDPAIEDPSGLTLGRIWLRLTPDEAAEFYRKIVEIEREYAARHAADDDDPAVRRYEMLIGLYATLPPEDAQPPPTG
ncbi:MAG TPA: helix-turn-helix domain-containing protein [Thermomicrobiales bacterium]|jgi:DNA-binding transcriptional ArsR family regulator